VIDQPFESISDGMHQQTEETTQTTFKYLLLEPQPFHSTSRSITSFCQTSTPTLLLTRWKPRKVFLFGLEASTLQTTNESTTGHRFVIGYDLLSKVRSYLLLADQASFVDDCCRAMKKRGEEFLTCSTSTLVCSKLFCLFSITPLTSDTRLFEGTVAAVHSQLQHHLRRYAWVEGIEHALLSLL